MSDKLLTSDELARQLAVRRSTIQRWTREGLIPAIKPNAKTRRYELREVTEALRRNQNDAK